ncbi:MAG: YceK/YidQ family lipoprotein [Pseudomonadota bacterium]
MSNFPSWLNSISSVPFCARNFRATGYNRFIHIAVISFLLTGCGTVNTVFRGDAVTSRTLKEYRTHCETIPRMYSGVAYDFCMLHGEPASIPSSQFQYGVPAVISDSVFSAVLDTFVLPYTIFRQVKDGNITIKNTPYNSDK